MFTTPGCVNISQVVAVTFLKVYLTLHGPFNVSCCTLQLLLSGKPAQRSLYNQEYLCLVPSD